MESNFLVPPRKRGLTERNETTGVRSCHTHRLLLRNQHRSSWEFRRKCGRPAGDGIRGRGVNRDRQPLRDRSNVSSAPAAATSSVVPGIEVRIRPAANGRISNSVSTWFESSLSVSQRLHTCKKINYDDYAEWMEESGPVATVTVSRGFLRETNRPSCVLQSSDFSTTRPGNWEMADSLLTICQLLPGSKAGESCSCRR